MELIVNDLLRHRIIDNFKAGITNLYVILSDSTITNSKRSTLPGVSEINLVYRLDKQGAITDRIYYAVKKSLISPIFIDTLATIDGIEYNLSNTGYAYKNMFNSMFVSAYLTNEADLTLSYDTISVVANLSSSGILKDIHQRYDDDDDGIDKLILTGCIIVSQYKAEHSYIDIHGSLALNILIPLAGE